jgi:hypothetical protein
VFGHRPRLAHTHQGDHPHPLRRQVGITIAVATSLALIALLLLPPHAHGNFVYWSSDSPNSSIGRAKINGMGQNNNFITGIGSPVGVAVDSRFIYWTDVAGNRIGRANLDGTGSAPNFITTGVSGAAAIAPTNSAIYWANDNGTIGRANLDGSGAVGNFISTTATFCALAADASFLYFLSGNKIGRATLDGSAIDPSFIPIPEPFCGLAVDASFLYWGSDSGNTIGRVPVGGGSPEGAFVAAGTTGGGPSGVTVNSQYVFWGNYTSGAVGRANINGSSVNPALIPDAGITGPGGPTPGNPSQLAAAPSNKLTIDSIARRKKKGIALIDARVPGPGQVTLSQTPGAEDPNAIAAAVKQIGLTITQASSFTLPVKPVGKTKKKLDKALQKKLRKRRKAKAKVKQQVFVTFVPAGVAGVPNSVPLTVKLVKVRKKRK